MMAGQPARLDPDCFGATGVAPDAGTPPGPSAGGPAAAPHAAAPSLIIDRAGGLGAGSNQTIDSDAPWSRPGPLLRLAARYGPHRRQVVGAHRIRRLHPTPKYGQSALHSRHTDNVDAKSCAVSGHGYGPSGSGRAGTRQRRRVQPSLRQTDAVD